jgi:hypothetical protein
MNNLALALVTAAIALFVIGGIIFFEWAFGEELEWLLSGELEDPQEDDDGCPW